MSSRPQFNQSRSTLRVAAVLLPAVALLVLDVPISSRVELGTSVAVAQTIEDRKAEADRLLEEGIQQYQVSQWREALQTWQRALDIYREISVREAFPQESRAGEADTLNNIGLAYQPSGDYATALDYHSQGLAIFREIGNCPGEALTLLNIGNIYVLLGDYPNALGYYNQSLAITRQIGEADGTSEVLRAGEATTLGNIGIVYRSLGNYPTALDYYNQSLAIARQIGDRAGEARTLGNIGIVYQSLGNFPIALDYYSQSLAIARQIGDRAGEATTLGNIGIVYRLLGDYLTALDYYNQSLVLKRAIDNRAGEATTLSNIGVIYQLLGDYSTALDYYNQSLVLKRQIGDRAGEAIIPSNIGEVYRLLGDYPTALDYYNQSLALTRQIGDRAGEATTLGNIGIIYDLSGDYPTALDYYNQSLVIKREIGDRAGGATTLSNMGRLFQAQEQPELAIVFLKESVNAYETIRERNRGLPEDLQELQETYTATIEDTYRTLADLLLQQDRILEAQQVLDLLKVQEVDDYLRGIRGVDERVSILRPEQAILAAYDELQKTAIDIGQELTELRQRRTRGETLSATEEQRLETLKDLQDEINRQFTAFLYSAEVEQHLADLSPRVLRQSIDLADLAGLQDNLAELNAVLLYPLILDDRLELVITTPVSPPLRRTVDVPKAHLNRIISGLRQAIRDPSSDPKDLAQELYSYLIRPIEQDLADLTDATAGDIPPTIIYAPDGALRYIPLAALHDGTDWLAQRFRINNITAKSFTEFQSEPVSNPQVLAAAFADDTLVHTVSVGDTPEAFRGLPFAGTEVTNLTNALNSIVAPLLDRDFTWDAVQTHLDVANIVHFATHAAAVPEAPEQSFILFGDGNTQTLLDIPNWPLENVDLVVLSACETGIPGQLTSGDEILGLGYQFQTRGARSVIASLWKVSDGGTQALMDAFYRALQQPGITKAEALRLAQVTLITGNDEALEDESRGLVAWEDTVQENLPEEVVNRLSHPYYWAPFILIGNGL